MKTVHVIAVTVLLTLIGCQQSTTTTPPTTTTTVAQATTTTTTTPVDGARPASRYTDDYVSILALSDTAHTDIDAFTADYVGQRLWTIGYVVEAYDRNVTIDYSERVAKLSLREANQSLAIDDQLNAICTVTGYDASTPLLPAAVIMTDCTIGAIFRGNEVIEGWPLSCETTTLEHLAAFSTHYNDTGRIHNCRYYNELLGITTTQQASGEGYEIITYVCDNPAELAAFKNSSGGASEVLSAAAECSEEWKQDLAEFFDSQGVTWDMIRENIGEQ